MNLQKPKKKNSMVATNLLFIFKSLEATDKIDNNWLWKQTHINSWNASWSIVIDFVLILNLIKSPKFIFNLWVVLKSWARVIRKYFNEQFSYLNLILETWNWKSIKNTWSIEAKILEKNLNFKANFKIRFLRRNDTSTRIKNFKASSYL